MHTEWNVNTEAIVARASSAISGGDVLEGRVLLAGVLRADPLQEQAWLSLAQLSATPEERRFCLREALRINTHNYQALGALVELGSGPTRCPAELGLALPAELLATLQPVLAPQLVLHPLAVEPEADPEPEAQLAGARTLRPLVLSLLLVLGLAAASRLPSVFALAAGM
jgi:hypothetical protein